MLTSSHNKHHLRWWELDSKTTQRYCCLLKKWWWCANSVRIDRFILLNEKYYLFTDRFLKNIKRFLKNIIQACLFVHLFNYKSEHKYLQTEALKTTSFWQTICDWTYCMRSDNINLHFLIQQPKEAICLSFVSVS